MWVDELVTLKVPKKIQITNVTLLSKEEYGKYRNTIPRWYTWWWLRSPCRYVETDADQVQSTMLVNSEPVWMSASVRPVLVFSDILSTLKVGDKLEVAGKTWTIIENGLALCDNSIGFKPFKENHKVKSANVYEKSDVKKYIDNWVKEQKIIIDKNDVNE